MIDKVKLGKCYLFKAFDTTNIIKVTSEGAYPNTYIVEKFSMGYNHITKRTFMYILENEYDRFFEIDNKDYDKIVKLVKTFESGLNAVLNNIRITLNK